MEEEKWITGGSSEVTSWVTTDDEVTGSMHTHESVCEVVGGSAALESLPELLVAAALQQRDDVVILEPAFSGEAVDVAREAARVVTESVAGGEVLVGVQGRAGRAREERANVGLPILEGSGLYAATTGTVGDLDLGVGVHGNTGEGLVHAAWGTLSADGGVGAVEKRRVGRVLVPPGVAVVGLAALVATLVAEGLLICPGEVPVPRKEVTSDVDVEGLLDVGGDEVIVSVPATRAHLLVELRGELGHALHCGDVGLLLRLGEG